MDEFTFKILELFYESKKMSMADENNPLRGATEETLNSYHYLIDGKYIDYNDVTCIIKITISGSSYVEERRKSTYLIELQKQNVKNQTGLKYCQYLLTFIAVVNILHIIFA